VIKRKQNRKNVSGDDVKDSDDEEEKEEDEDEEGDIDDDFHDLDFHCESEIFKSKKGALSKKISKTEWSG